MYESDKIGDSLPWRSWCYFEAQVWKKDSSIVPFIFYFLFGLSFFYLAFIFILFLSRESHPNLWGNHSLHHPFLTWDTARIMMIITLLFTYNSTSRTKIWLYMNASGGVPGWCNGPRVTCMKELWMVALPQILCQLHDHAKQYDNDAQVMYMMMMEVEWKYISEWLWKCHDR